MEKEFVPYQEALELKKLGFDERCLAWTIPGNENYVMYQCEKYNGRESLMTQIPTFSQAFRWFREKYNLIGSVCEDVDGNFSLWTNKGNLLLQGKEYKEYKTYEEAELACLRKLIEIVKSNG